MRIWGQDFIFTVDIMNRITGKLRRILLLDFGLITFKIHYWKTRKHLMFMVSGPGGRDHDSKNQLILILKSPRNSKTLLKIQENPNTFQKNIFLEIRESTNVNISKMCVPTIPKLEFLEHLNFEKLKKKLWNCEAVISFIFSEGIPTTPLGLVVPPPSQQTK